MSTNDTYIGVFLGNKTSARSKAWAAMSDAERLAKQKEGGAAWGAWMAKNGASIVTSGGPLGKTKRVSARGVEDASNEMSAFVVVRAASHDAAAKMFENHPHFSIFPGDAVEVMPVLPIPGM